MVQESDGKPASNIGALKHSVWETNEKESSVCVYKATASLEWLRCGEA